MRRIVVEIGLTLAAVLVLAAFAWPGPGDESASAAQHSGPASDGPAFHGYTLLAPIFSTTTYLIDMAGRVVHTWETDLEPGQSVYLLADGNLLRTGSLGPQNRVFHGGGAGGRVQELSWDGTLVWDFEYSSHQVLAHHDVERLPNGNVLMIAWEKKSVAAAVAAGRDADLLGPSGLWVDHVVEVRPTGKSTGDPERVDLNYSASWSGQLSEDDRDRLTALGYLQGSGSGRRDVDPDWTHVNSIDYNEELDQIVVSVLGFNEIWIIDHSTTTRQAAGHTGGRSGKGGDLLYRWGNAAAYRAGTPAQQRFFAQHDAHWIAPGLPGAGNLLVFNNGRDRPDGRYSSVDEIVPPVDAAGRYLRESAGAFGPPRPVWTYTARPKTDFYSINVSGAQRLANGNTLICSGATGTIFEVTSAGEPVWEFVNPFGAESGRPPHAGRRPPGGHGRRGPRRAGPPPAAPRNTVFRAYRYAPEYLPFRGAPSPWGDRGETPTSCQ